MKVERNSRMTKVSDRIMGGFADKKFDWIAGLALVCGAAVMIPSLAAFSVTLIAIIAALF